MAPNPASASRNAIDGQSALQGHRAHRAEGVVAAAALQHAEAEQDRQGADVRDQQVEKAGAADLGNAVIGRHQEERGERHGLPGDHEYERVVGDQHQGHRGEEGVVLQAQQARRGAFAGAEVSGGEDRDAGRGGAEQEKEESGQRVQTQVKGQIGQPSGSTVVCATWVSANSATPATKSPTRAPALNSTRPT